MHWGMYCTQDEEQNQGWPVLSWGSQANEEADSNQRSSQVLAVILGVTAYRDIIQFVIHIPCSSPT